MNMQTVVWSATSLSIIVCLAIGARHSLKVTRIGDILPLILGRTARVESHREFSASTVAATISLATVVVAFYELVPMLGLWLLWPGITTAMGLGLFSILAKRVWQKISHYEYRPTLHAYLGTEFASKRLAFVASIFTAAGYLTAFAVELTVGSRFLSPLLTGIPTIVLVALIAIVSFVYTGLGGFRTVVVTDRLQMGFIWMLLLATGVYYAVTLQDSGLVGGIARIPANLRSLSWRNDRIAFVLGILVMNLLTYISNMGLWQRIAGSQNADTVSAGLWSSVRSSVASWSLLALAAVGAFMIVTPVNGENLLVTVLKSMQYSRFGLVAIFFVVLGLLGAMLSTASTQLMAVTHTIYEDLVAPFRKAGLRERVNLGGEVFLSRTILVVSAVLSIAVVEGLRAVGFSVADLAFAVYGAALGLVPPILLTLYLPRTVTSRLSTPAIIAVSLGFVSCWSAAAYGRIHGNGNIVFLSPIVSTLVATVVMGIGWMMLTLLKRPRFEQTST
jgi:Na+/proline symporter